MESIQPPWLLQASDPVITPQVLPVLGQPSRAQGSPQKSLVQSREKAPCLPTWRECPLFFPLSLQPPGQSRVGLGLLRLLPLLRALTQGPQGTRDCEGEER